MSDQAPNPPPDVPDDEWQRFLTLWEANESAIHIHMLVLICERQECLEQLIAVTMRTAFQRFHEVKNEADFLPWVIKILRKVEKTLPVKRRRRLFAEFKIRASWFGNRLRRNCWRKPLVLGKIHLTKTKRRVRQVILRYRK